MVEVTVSREALEELAELAGSYAGIPMATQELAQLAVVMSAIKSKIETILSNNGSSMQTPVETFGDKSVAP